MENKGWLVKAKGSGFSLLCQSQESVQSWVAWIVDCGGVPEVEEI